jgi:phage head maturation protease
MKLFVPFDISKADDAERIVEGYASTEALDSQGEIVTRKAMESALPDWLKFGNIREMHQPSAVGVAMTAEHDDKGLKLCAKIVDPLAWEKVKEGVYKGFSIGGRVTNRDKVNKSIITGIHLTEISLVDRPANPEALFDVWKAEGGAPGEEMRKGMLAVQMLANIVDQVSRLATKSKIEEDKENDTDSTVPASLQDAMNQLGSILQDMVEEETAELAEGGSGPGDPYCDSLYLNANNVDVEKKDYSEAERKDMTSDGRAMPDGSFPIANKDDLENAIQAVGRAKDKEAAMAHIRKRAEDLGLEDMIPDTWKTDEPVDLEKKGKRNSNSDQKKLNDAHDAIVAAGAQCDAAKHEATADLSKAQDDLAQSAIEIAKLHTQIATEQAATAELTKARDDATAALADLNKAHTTVVTEREDLAKQVETLTTEKAAQAEELDALKKEVEELKARPEPIKGKLLSVGKGDDITANAATKSAAAQAVTAPQEKWFSARPQ